MGGARFCELVIMNVSHVEVSCMKLFRVLFECTIIDSLLWGVALLFLLGLVIWRFIQPFFFWRGSFGKLSLAYFDVLLRAKLPLLLFKTRFEVFAPVSFLESKRLLNSFGNYERIAPPFFFIFSKMKICDYIRLYTFINVCLTF